MTSPHEHFTGTVTAQALAIPTTESVLAVYVMTFEPAARTHWHTHPKGQGLYVTDGVAVVQSEEEPTIRLQAGEALWIEAGRRHWHGVDGNASMTHVAYQEAGDNLATVEWHEPVTAETFARALEGNR